MLLIQKLGRTLFTISGMLMLMAALVVWANPVMGEEVLPAEVASGVESDAQSAPCKGLKPFKNIDELLYQFYINLDSDCLFEMSTAELEQVWGIKILDNERARPKNYYPLSETEFFNKQYKSEKDAFYVELMEGDYYGHRFRLLITKEYLEKHGTLFPDRKMPTFLPEPDRVGMIAFSEHEPCVFPRFIGKASNVGGGSGSACYVGEWIKPAATIRMANYDEIIIRQRDYANKKKLKKSPRAKLTEIDENDRNAPCRGLKPYKDFDELLYQFYINLDSDCMFLMPPGELEDLWDVEFLFPTPKVKTKYTFEDFYEMPYETERDAFFIQPKGNNSPHPSFNNGNPYISRFDVITTSEYYDKKGGLMKGRDVHYNSLRLLPPPNTEFSGWISSDNRRRMLVSRFMTPAGNYRDNIVIFFSPEAPDDETLNKTIK